MPPAVDHRSLLGEHTPALRFSALESYRPEPFGAPRRREPQLAEAQGRPRDRRDQPHARPKGDQTEPVLLVVSVDPGAEAAPPATYSFPLERLQGTVRRPAVLRRAART